MNEVWGKSGHDKTSVMSSEILLVQEMMLKNHRKVFFSYRNTETTLFCKKNIEYILNKGTSSKYKNDF